MWFLLLLLCAFATCVAAQQDFPADDANALLLHVRKNVTLTLERLPKYLCTETIDRSFFEAEADVTSASCDDIAKLRQEPDWSMRQYSSDRLRLDVAVSGGSEMYSWAGKARFHERSLADLVRGGATSTGAFASFLRAIFGTDAAAFSYNGDVSFDGRSLVEYSFTVPLEKSGLRISNRLHNAIVAYHGTFLVDPKTSDLVRLTIRADDLPAELQTCEDVTTLDYGHVQFSKVISLLPKEARLQVYHVNGSVSLNRTVFSGCHEFRGESSLEFGDVPAAELATSRKPAPQPLVLPPKCRFRLALTQAIDTGSAAAGDPVQAKLISPIKDAHNRVLVRKGTAITGRIVQAKRIYRGASAALTLAVRLETIEVDGVSIPFGAKLESRWHKTIRTLDAAEASRTLGSFDQIVAQADANAGVLEFLNVSSNYVIDRGFEMDGMTVAH
jgi:hypothetical protein